MENGKSVSIIIWLFIFTDFGPSHGYWCFAYERMNGTLTNIPKSNTNIESQIMKTWSYELQEDSTITDACIPKALKMFTSTEAKAIDTVSNYYDTHYVIQKFNQLSMDNYEFQCKVDRGDVTNWTVQLLHPRRCRVKVCGTFYDELCHFFHNMYEVDVYVKPIIDKYGRCAVNGQTFSSQYNSTDRCSVVKAMFVIKETGELHPYFGIVLFFFKVCVTLKHNQNGVNPIEEKTLAYVAWMTFKSPERDKASGLYMVNNTYYETDKIISPRRFVNRCTLARVRDSASYYVSELPL